jgi:putative PEP-CTERM system TPR-repeat lipoprotein
MPLAPLRPSALLLLALTLVGTAPLALAATTTEKAAGYYEDAQVRFQAADYTAAVIQLKNALKEEAAHLPSRLLLGRTYLRLGQPGAAEETLRYALDRGADPRLVELPLLTAMVEQRKYAEVVERGKRGARPPEVEAEVQVLVGKAQMGLGKLDEAQQAFFAAETLAPYEAGPAVGRAQLLLARGDTRTAANLVERALRLAPDSPEAWFVRAEIRRLSADLPGAVDDYGKAIELDPRHLQARIHRAATLIDLRRDEEAAADLDFVRADAPNQPQAAYLKALVLARANDVEGARAVMQEASAMVSALDPEVLKSHPPSLLLAGVISFNQGNYEETRTYLQRYLQQDPYHAGARKMLGTVLLRQGEVEAAIQVLAPATQVAPTDAELHALLGGAYLQAKQYAAASGAFEKAAELAPSDAVARAQLGVARLALGMGEQGRSDVEAALTLKDDPIRAALLVANLYVGQGAYDKALAVALRVTERAPKNPLGHYLAAQAYLGKGARTEARAAFERALQADPKLLAAEFGIAGVDLRDGKVDAARKRYEAILSANPREARALSALAEIARAQGDFDGAVKHLEAATKADPKAVGPRVQLVYMELQRKEPKRALDLARQLAWENAEVAEVHEALGLAQLSQGLEEEARESFRRLSRYSVRAAAPLYKAAALQLQAKDPQGARFSLEQALAAEPGHVPSRVALARLDAREGRVQEAIDRARGLEAQQGESGLAAGLEGEVLLGAGRFQEAVAAYEAAWAREQTTGVALGLFRARWGAGARAEALKGLHAWVDGHPEDDGARRALAVGYLDNGQLPQARDLHEQLLKASPEDANLLNNLAWVYQKLGDKRALEVARQAYGLSPEQASTLDTLGWILVEGGDAEGGIRYLREAYARASAVPEVRYHLGVALAQLGRKDEARTELKAALKLSETFDGADTARALLRELGG